MLFFLNSCKKNDNISKITHSDIGIKDSLHFKIQNKSNTNYVLYIEKRRLYYNASLPNQISMNFVDKDKPVVISQDFTAPFFMLDEEGNLSTEDSILQASYIDCIKKNRDWVLVVPAKKMIEFRMPLIDTIDYCGRLNYPVLNRGVEYKASINYV